MKFKVGDRVYKLSGYTFPGIVVATFETLQGEHRVVVETTLSIGLLHIFNEDQLEHQDG